MVSLYTLVYVKTTPEKLFKTIFSKYSKYMEEIKDLKMILFDLQLILITTYKDCRR